MKRLVVIVLIGAALILNWQRSSADIISPEAVSAEKRLRENPNTFDMADQFCEDKKRGDACSIAGTVFAGGGDGLCQIELPRRASVIVMSCVRQGDVVIERDLTPVPSAQRERSRSGTGEPKDPLPTDRFCRGKEVGNACTVSLAYQAKNELHQGVCKEVNQTLGYRDFRKVVSCEPDTPVEHTYTPVSWWKKLVQ